MSRDALLEVRNLTTRFPVKGGFFHRTVGHVEAVTDVSLSIRRGRTLGLVGESGCGKTTLGRTVLKLVEPTEGTIVFDGEDITRHGRGRMRPLRRRMQIVFQDPFASLNPRMTVQDILQEPLEIHKPSMTRRARRRRVESLVGQVRLQAGDLERYPHEFSGGQRQRICIARALAAEPDFVVCDEPVSALDVSVQAQIINLLTDLQEELGLAYLFITHDLKIVEHIAHQVAVMYLGRIVETGTPAELGSGAMHPYTQALYSAVPRARPGEARGRILLEGDIPSPKDPPPGCHFHPRCRYATGRCLREYPAEMRVSPTHGYKCFRHMEDGG